VGIYEQAILQGKIPAKSEKTRVWLNILRLTGHKSCYITSIAAFLFSAMDLIAWNRRVVLQIQSSSRSPHCEKKLLNWHQSHALVWPIERNVRMRLFASGLEIVAEFLWVVAIRFDLDRMVTFNAQKDFITFKRRSIRPVSEIEMRGYRGVRQQLSELRFRSKEESDRKRFLSTWRLLVDHRITRGAYEIESSVWYFTKHNTTFAPSLLHVHGVFGWHHKDQGRYLPACLIRSRERQRYR
jgi:hypothetical protein